VVSGTLQQPLGGHLPDGDVTNATFAFDPRNHRYVEIEMGGNALWYVSAAPAPADGAFHWTDLAAAVPPSHWNMTLPQHGAFTIEAYNRPEDKAPSYRATCERKKA
jgi:hypothetical protein